MALPGVRTVIQDRFFTLSRTDVPVGPRVAAIGKRTTKGPGETGYSSQTLPQYATAYTDITARSLDAYEATSEKDVVIQFGSGSQLHRAYLELASAGALRISLVALPSDTVFNHTTAALSSALYPALDPFIAAFDACEAAQADVIVPWGRGSAVEEWESPATPGNDPEFGFYADNSNSANSWAKKVADQCAVITDRSNPVLAVLGVKPFVGTSENMTATDVNTFLTFSNLIDNDGAVIGNNGFFVSVVAIDVHPLGYPVSYGYANGACTYAATIVSLDSWNATTGKVLYNVDRTRWEPTRTQQETLISKGIVPAAPDFSRTLRWIDGRTFAKDTSDYVRLTTLRIIYDAIQLVRNIAQRYVGQAASLANRNSLETAISRGLQGMQQLGATLDTQYRVTYVPAENKAVIDLNIQPAFELRTIEVTVAVQL